MTVLTRRRCAHRGPVNADLPDRFWLFDSPHDQAQRHGHDGDIGGRQRRRQPLGRNTQGGGNVVHHIHRKHPRTLRGVEAHLRNASLMVASGGNDVNVAQINNFNGASSSIILNDTPQPTLSFLSSQPNLLAAVDTPTAAPTESTTATGAGNGSGVPTWTAGWTKGL